MKRRGSLLALALTLYLFSLGSVANFLHTETQPQLNDDCIICHFQASAVGESLALSFFQPQLVYLLAQPGEPADCYRTAGVVAPISIRAPPASC